MQNDLITTLHFYLWSFFALYKCFCFLSLGFKKSHDLNIQSCPFQKPVAAPSKPTGARSAARSRLAAAKAAMKAKQQAAEKAAKEDGDDDDDDSCSNTQEPQPQEVPQPADSVVFDGGFFQVESPLKPPG